MYGYTDFGKKIKIAMVSLNLTNRALARHLGYTESTLCDVLKGRNRNALRMDEIETAISNMQKLEGG